MTAPLIFDLSLRRLRRDRAAAGFSSADFLLREVEARLIERLEDVTRRFPRAAVLGAWDGGMARLIRGRFGIEEILQVESSPRFAALAGGPVVVAEPEALPLMEERFDLIISPLVLHGVNDLPGALVQIRRALKPDGFFLAAMMAGESLMGLRRALIEAELEISGGASPRVAPFAETRALGMLLQRAGFALPTADLDRIDVDYASMLGLMRDLKGMGESNALIERRRRFATRGLFARAMEIYAAREGRPDGRVAARFEIAFLAGWAPDESQPKPARPGSAKARLADALKTMEIKL